jgi:uncharacterized membrane protein YebE (DUF533 family)
MPSPTIVPLIVAGIMMGIVLRTTKAHVSGKFIIVGSLLGGLGNLANAVLLYLFQGQQTSQALPQAIPQATPRAFAGSQMMTAQSLTSFLVVSFIIGTLMILLVFVSARLIMRVRGRKIVEEEEQQPSD